MYLESKSKALLDSVVEKSPSERTMKPPSERTPGNMPSQFVSRKSARAYCPMELVHTYFSKTCAPELPHWIEEAMPIPNNKSPSEFDLLPITPGLLKAS